jgi:Zn-dependent protease with chaperone function
MLKAIRIPEEKILYDKLWSWLAADTILQLMVQSGLSGSRRDNNSDSNPLWPIKNSLPDLRRILDRTLEQLSMQHMEIDFYLQGGNAPLASSRIAITEKGELAEIVFSSKLLEPLTRDEIKAVVAHELAHIYFGHARLQLCIDWVDLASKQGRLYALSNLYTFWRQLAEISADRASLLVVNEPASSVSFLARQKIEKFTAELDTSAYMDEARNSLADNSIQLSRRDSHPPLEIRALAMENFRKSVFYANLREGKSIIADDSIQSIENLTEMLKTSPGSHEQFLEFTFLMTAGNYLIQADSDIHKTEVIKLRDILARLLHAPDKTMFCMEDNDSCKECLHEIGGQIATTFPARGIEIFELLCSLVVQDGKIASTEKSALEQIATVLNIPDEIMARILLKVLRQEFHPSM